MDNKLEEQKRLAAVIKSIHQDLRDSTSLLGAEEAWNAHLLRKDKLHLYAKSMRALSEEHWKDRNSSADDRIRWIEDACNEYFQESALHEHRQKDLEIIAKLRLEGQDIEASDVLKLDGKLRVIDVGSSGNFFRNNEQFDILPIDIAPSSKEVLYCDFLSVPITQTLSSDSEQVYILPASSFDVVLFCLLLEYLPASEMRVKCCEKAYEILKTEGILCLITPDSNYQHTNAQQIKNWKWTLANMGFKRIKMEKLTNLSCMVFRKSLSREVSRRWATLRKAPYMEYKMEIPQDRKKTKVVSQEEEEEDAPRRANSCEYSTDIMHELPFE